MRSRPKQAWHTLLLVAGLASGAGAEPLCEAQAPYGVFRVAPTDLPTEKLRVGALPGDWALRNRTATAVIRARDGSLVDFWLEARTAPTAPQLSGEDDIDGIWSLVPQLRDARGPMNLAAHEIRGGERHVETVARLALGAGAVEVSTRWELDGDAPRLLITSTVRHRGGGKLTALSLGDFVKWGNVDYFVSGVGRAKPTFSGRARWVGRRGASGDLMLETAEDRSMGLDFRLLETGSAPAIYTRYADFPLPPGGERTLRRRLEYRSIDTQAPPTPIERAPSGDLRISVVDEDGAPLASKLSLRGLSGTPTPDFGNDGDVDGAARFVWSGTGQFARALPPGRYRVIATAGFERQHASVDVTVSDGGVARETLRLPRAYPTAGWVSGDLHLHQAASVDADIGDRARIVSVAAEGVELAVASDHYTAHDLAPAQQRLIDDGKLTRPLITLMGSEVSTVGELFGHFNLFPLTEAPAVDYEDTNPRELFAAMRRAAPKALLQVNHPRFGGLGYFQRYRLDPKTGRVPFQHKQEFDEGYDLLEVFNGMDAESEPRVRLVLRDFLHLLGQGKRYVATGNSDSHKLFFNDPGLPRNFIHWREGASDAEDAQADVGEVLDALRTGRVVVSSGPFIDARIGSVGPGGVVKGSRTPSLHIKVFAADWIDVTHVEVLVGSEGDRVRFIGVPRSKAPLRLETIVPLKVDGPSFVVVVARGERPLPNVYTPDVEPFAFTNPIWIEP